MATHDSDGVIGPSALPQGYGYDAHGLWVWLSSADRTHWRYWRGSRVVNEVRVASDGGDDVEVTWVAAAATTVAEQVQGPGARSALIASVGGGSVLLEADSEVRSLAYAPHGHRDESTARTTPGFNGEWLDVASGFYLLGSGHHRPYSPRLGLFLAPDAASPFGAGGLNTLAYCAGDPVNRADPSGHFWKWIVAGVGLALGVAATVATFGAASAAVGAMAAGGLAALTKSGAAALAATTLGMLSVGVEVGAMAAGASGDQNSARVLGWIGLGLGIAGAVPAIAKTAMKGATRFARFAQRVGGRRSSAIPMGGAAGRGRATQAALPSGAGSAALSRSSSVSSSEGSWASSMFTLDSDFNTVWSRRGERRLRGLLQNRTPSVSSRASSASNASFSSWSRATSSSSSSSSSGSWVAPSSWAAHFSGASDDLAGAAPGSMWHYTPTLKAHPSPAYTTGHLQTGALSAPGRIDADAHLAVMEMMGTMVPDARLARMIRSMRRLEARLAAWRDPPPVYDRATLPGYDSLGFGG